MARLRDSIPDRPGNKDIRQLARILGFLAPYRRQVAIAMVALVVAAACVLVLGQGLRRVIDGVLREARLPQDMDQVFDLMLDFLDDTGAATVAFAQGGDQIGGVKGGNFKQGIVRKAMNTFFCRTDRPVGFLGRLNEDVNAYVVHGSRGCAFGERPKVRGLPHRREQGL